MLDKLPQKKVGGKCGDRPAELIRKITQEKWKSMNLFLRKEKIKGKVNKIANTNIVFFYIYIFKSNIAI